MPVRAEPSPEVVFRALSDATRLRILCLLRGREVCVCDFTSVLNVPQPKVSRHLAYLRKAGLVACRKDGPWCWYRLALADDEFSGAIRACLDTVEPKLPGYKRVSSRLATRPCCATLDRS
ncbi:MAG: ArsR/SmtB family transcription factor [Phycisphaerae bacterium]